MIWNCPLCHTPLDAASRDWPDAIYRCRICKLEFVRDKGGTGLKLRPFSDEMEDGEGARR